VGAIPAGACAEGHGWEWIDTDDGDRTRSPLWLARCRSSSGDGVRLGYVRRGDGAYVGSEGQEQPVAEYDVLLDAGTWQEAEWRNEEEDVLVAIPGAVACGETPDGAPVYATLRHREGEGEQPAESSATASQNFTRSVLVQPVGAAAGAAEAAPARPGSAEAPLAGEPVATGYRWGPAARGDIPDGAAARHGWRWRDTQDGGQEEEPLWVARSLSDADGSVRLGYVARGEPARLGQEYHEELVDEYEVLLDAGNWRWPHPILEDDDEYFDLVAAGGVPCGRLADGTPLYATLRNLEGAGENPGESRARAAFDFARGVLVAPAGATAPDAAPAAPTESEPTGPIAVVSALDLKGEVAEIMNVGDSPLDLGGWKLRDNSKGKPYVFPGGTVLAAGGSVRVRSGPGAKKPAPGELVWKTATVWNDRGDTAFLEDSSGGVVATRKG